MKVDREDFRAWLTAKEPDDVVGYTHEPELCPIAKWSGQRVESPEGWPTWVDSFVCRVDSRGLIWDTVQNGLGTPVSAKDALTILDGIE